jgi:hypothetical protein
MVQVHEWGKARITHEHDYDGFPAVIPHIIHAQKNLQTLPLGRRGIGNDNETETPSKIARVGGPQVRSFNLFTCVYRETFQIFWEHHQMRT